MNAGIFEKQLNNKNWFYLTNFSKYYFENFEIYIKLRKDNKKYESCKKILKLIPKIQSNWNSKVAKKGDLPKNKKSLKILKIT